MRLLSRFQKPSVLIGLDIQHNAINLLELSYKQSQYSLVAVNRIPNESGDMAGMLEQTLPRVKSPGKAIAIAIDHSAVLFKTAEVAATLTEGEIFLHLCNRASQSFNLPPEALLLDFTIIGPAKTQANLIEVRWVATKQANVKPWLKQLANANYHLTLIDVSSLALQRAVNFLMTNHTIVCVHISDRSLLLTILHQGQAIYTFAEPWPTIPVDDQEITKKLLTFITRNLQFYHGMESSPVITLVLLSGNYLTTETALTLQSSMDTNVELANPWKAAISIPQELQKQLSAHKAHEFMTSFGLALRCGEQYAD